jgi:hypothetical protein
MLLLSLASKLGLHLVTLAHLSNISRNSPKTGTSQTDVWQGCNRLLQYAINIYCGQIESKKRKQISYSCLETRLASIYFILIG